jgi:hypothetical protein
MLLSTVNRLQFASKQTSFSCTIYVQEKDSKKKNLNVSRFKKNLILT